MVTAYRRIIARAECRGCVVLIPRRKIEVADETTDGCIVQRVDGGAVARVCAEPCRIERGDVLVGEVDQLDVLGRRPLEQRLQRRQPSGGVGATIDADPDIRRIMSDTECAQAFGNDGRRVRWQAQRCAQASRGFVDGHGIRYGTIDIPGVPPFSGDVDRNALEPLFVDRLHKGGMAYGKHVL